MLIIAFLAAGIIACSSEQHADLVQYVEKIKSKKGGRIEPLPEFKSYESYIYTEKDLRDPFQPTQKAAISEDEMSGDGLKPDTTRHKEALEAFPLDSLVFSGSLEQNNVIWAVIKAPDGLVYKVQVGNYIGLNYGKITNISETGIDVVEIVPNGLGNWTEREATLSLSED